MYCQLLVQCCGLLVKSICCYDTHNHTVGVVSLTVQLSAWSLTGEHMRSSAALTLLTARLAARIKHLSCRLMSTSAVYMYACPPSCCIHKP